MRSYTPGTSQVCALFAFRRRCGLATSSRHDTQDEWCGGGPYQNSQVFSHPLPAFLRTLLLGVRAFSNAAPKLWNSTSAHYSETAEFEANVLEKPKDLSVLRDLNLL